MSGLEAIDIAFLPKDVPYTMNDSMFIEAARVIRPKILLPYHCPKPRIDRTMLRNALPGMTIPRPWKSCSVWTIWAPTMCRPCG